MAVGVQLGERNVEKGCNISPFSEDRVEMHVGCVRLTVESLEVTVHDRHRVTIQSEPRLSHGVLCRITQPQHRNPPRQRLLSFDSSWYPNRKTMGRLDVMLKGSRALT